MEAFLEIFTTPDGQDLLDLLLAVRLCGDDEQPVQQIDGDPVGTAVRGATDPEEENSNSQTLNKGQLYWQKAT